MSNLIDWSEDMLSGQVALITGATRGIGRSTAEVFARNGARLFLNGRDEACLEQLAAKLRNDFNIDADAACFDVSDPSSVKDGFQALFKQTKQLDILVNNAGILADGLIGMVSAEQLQRVFAVNTFGTIYCTQYASRLMARNDGGSIINISSIMGINGEVGQTVYSASKAAVVGITKSLSKELASQNIRVNAVAPGFIDTDMANSIPADKFTQRLQSIRMGRIGTPEEVANTILFLASGLSTYVTGQTIGVDGGMLM